MQFAPGSRLGPYEILAPLGAGGMGEVHRARDTRLGRDVAIKFSKDKFSERFEREARTIAALNHPHICQLYDVGPNYLVMELIDGTPLKGPLPLEKAVEYATQILDALDAAHQKGITHRDLKPANILVTKQGIKLLDFGLAKQSAVLNETDATMTDALTEQGQMLGTFHYMSPEQLQAKEAGPRSDLFSFGCVLYEMLNGKSPFRGESAASVIAAILEREPAPLTIAPRLEWILKRSLAKDPDQRFQTARDLKASLNAAMEQPVPAVPAPNRRLWWAPIAAAFVVFAALAYQKLQRPNAAAAPTAIRITRLTRDGQSFFPVLSHDARFVAYASRAAGVDNTEIYVRQLNGTGTVRVTNHPGMDTRPAFSADGSRLYFYSARRPSGVYEAPALGGDARLLIADADFPAASPDGKWLSYSIGANVFIRSLSGAVVRQVTTDKRLGTEQVWSPDSTQLAFITRLPGSGGSELTVTSVDGNPPRKFALFQNLASRGMYLTFQNRLVGWLAGNSLLFIAPFGDAATVWSLPIEISGTADPRPITLATLGPFATADGRAGKLVFTNPSRLSQLWRLAADLDRGTVSAPLRRLTDEKANTFHQDLSRDGRLLAYTSHRSGDQDVWLKDLTTGHERQLTSGSADGGRYAHLTFSPDASKIAAHFAPARSADAVNEIRLLNISTGEIRRLSNEGARIRGWTPDGRYLIIWLTRQGDGIAVIDTDIGSLHSIIPSPARLPRLSFDGKWLAFMKGNDLYVGRFHGKEPIVESECIRVASNVYHPFWSPNGRNLYFATLNDDGAGFTAIMRQPFDPDSGAPLGQRVEFYSLQGLSLADAIVNQVIGATGGIVLALVEESSDIWAIDLRN